MKDGKLTIDLRSKKFWLVFAIVVIAIVSIIVLALNQPKISYQLSNDTASSSSETSQNADSSKKNVLMLATGGTIAGSGEAGKETGYKPGALSAESIIASVPGIEKIANIKAEQICNLNSDDITQTEWLQLANRINQIDSDPNVDGVVITHGTDTMEETAFFLNLVVKTEKPVVITGSMRPATAISADGPMNLYQAVLVAANSEAKGKPVMAVMDDSIMSARTFQKTSTSALNTMQNADLGVLGIVRDDNVIFTNNGDNQTFKNHTEFSIDNISSLPKVNVVYFNVDADVEMLKQAIRVSDAVVIAGAGAGEYSEKFKAVVESSSIPIIISTRTSSGVILQDSLISKKTIASSYLNPQKAAVLARVALSGKKNITQDELVRIFTAY